MIEKHRPLDVSLKGRSRIWIGRRIRATDDPHLELDDPRVDLDHCVLVQQPGTKHYWLADSGSAHGTFVNRRLIRSVRLQSGDLIQIGSFAWIFSGEDGYLIPGSRIEGVQLELRDLTVGDLMKGLKLTVPAGQFLAITGPSGAGKSTLIKAIVGASGAYDAGQVLINGQEQQAHETWFRSLLGYASQDKVILGDLRTWEAVVFASRLRGGAAEHRVMARVLREVDLPDKCWRTLVRHLSGGEEKRLRTAAELAEQPRLLVLDEPSSGLDQDREERLLRLLRSLSYRGCTVLVVTHNLTRLDCFDRILAIDDGKIRFDGTPAELKQCAPDGRLGNLDEQTAEHSAVADALPSNQDCVSTIDSGHSRNDLNYPARTNSLLLQFVYLVLRELIQLSNAPFRRIVLPALSLPAFFGMALDMSVRPEDRQLLGFLSILSVIWMGASLGLMAIVDEREVFQHERLLFLRVIPYLASKAAVLSVLAFQTWFFVGLLWCLRGTTEEAGTMLYGAGWVGLILSLTAWAGLSVGLLLSALAGEHKPVASFLLPLVMIAQIVFSIQVAGRRDAVLHDAYGEFNLHCCQGADLCLRRAQIWLPQAGGRWVCQECQSMQQRANRSPDAVVDREEDRLRPARWATLASYLTIARYADIALRSFAYWQADFEAFRQSTAADPAYSSRAVRFEYARWRYEAVGVLAMGGVLMLLATAAWLEWGQALRTHGHHVHGVAPGRAPTKANYERHA